MCVVCTASSRILPVSWQTPLETNSIPDYKRCLSELGLRPVCSNSASSAPSGPTKCTPAPPEDSWTAAVCRVRCRARFCLQLQRPGRAPAPGGSGPIRPGGPASARGSAWTVTLVKLLANRVCSHWHYRVAIALYRSRLLAKQACFNSSVHR